MISAWIAPIIAGSICGILLTWLSKRSHHLPLDHPTERSLHTHPTPRIGGLGLVPGLLIGWACTSSFDPFLAVTAALTGMLFLMSAIDDRHSLPVATRLGAHVAVGLILASMLVSNQGWLTVIGLGFALAWMTNLYNFMDGANGLAGGMATFGFATYGVAATMAGADSLALLSLATAGAALGFLPFNFDPAKLFLGDAGSIPLGFLSGALGLVGAIRDIWPLWFPLLVFSPFVIDASTTLARRALRGSRVSQAHRDHYYQRLIRMGWSHRRLALSQYGLMATTGLSAIALRNANGVVQVIGLITWAGIFAVAMIIIDRLWAAHRVEVAA